MTPAFLPLLNVQDLRKSFGGVEAVCGVSFDVRRGQLVALIGTNGAGKTTCFNCINGQLRPDGGQVFFNPGALTTSERLAHEKNGAPVAPAQTPAQNITGEPPRALAFLGIGRTFQITAIFASMTVRENVQMVLMSLRGKVWRFWAPAAAHYRAEADALLETVGLAEQAEAHTATLAYGDLKRLELAMALAGSPKLLLMDEPTAGMGLEERDALMGLTHRIAREKGLGVLFTEHDMDAVFTYADWIIVMHQGNVIARGNAATIRNDPHVRAVYLGKEAA